MCQLCSFSSCVFLRVKRFPFFGERSAYLFFVFHRQRVAKIFSLSFMAEAFVSFFSDWKNKTLQQKASHSVVFERSVQQRFSGSFRKILRKRSEGKDESSGITHVKGRSPTGARVSERIPSYQRQASSVSSSWHTARTRGKSGESSVVAIVANLRREGFGREV